jgi:putative Ca2+/H+ antiporter (TMEM165/GDT1 family)
MQWRVFLSTFGLVFLAEIGDKTQLMTISLVGKTKAPLAVFAGSCLALCAVTAIGVLAGEVLTRVVPASYLQKGAALLFIGIGIVMLFAKR